MKFLESLTTPKILLLIGTTIGCLCGLGMLIRGCMSYTQAFGPKDEAMAEEATGTFMIAFGVYTIAIMALGLGGTIMENSCMLTTFMTFMIIAAVARLILGITLLAAVSGILRPLQKGVERNLEEQFDSYVMNPTSEKKKAIDELQQENQCCGVKGPDYWKEKAIWFSNKPPSSCYADEKDPDTLFKTGCADTGFLNLHTVINGVAILFLVISVLAMALAVLAHIVKKQVRENANEQV